MDKSHSMNLPETFLTNLTTAFGRSATDDWIARLPRLLTESASRWDLELGAPVDGLSYNYVCSASHRPERSDAKSKGDYILKVGIPNRELTSEIECLRLLGNLPNCPIVHLLESDPENGLLLLERLRPGADLTSIPDDDRATQIAAGVMSRLWLPASEKVRHCEEGALPAAIPCMSFY